MTHCVMVCHIMPFMRDIIHIVEKFPGGGNSPSTTPADTLD